ncbi:MAG: ATP-binding protein [Acidimicrobiales bacterium]
MYTYLAGLVGLFVLGAAAGAIFVRVQAESDAHHAAVSQATVAAKAASATLSESLVSLQASAQTLAQNPALPELVSHPGPCGLQYSSSKPFGSGHIDIVGANGSVICSSLGTRAQAKLSDAGASWLATAKARPMVSGPEPDPAGGQPALIVTAPFSSGVVAIVVDLAPVGPGLASQVGDAGHVSFLVANRAGEVLARSIAPQDWIGHPLAGTAFEKAGATSDHRDLDGTPRIYTEKTISPLGWRVYAGVDRASALASADSLFLQDVAIILACLFLVIVAASVVHRRLAKPIRLLTASVRSAHPGAAPGEIPVSGPSEVAELGEGFRRLLQSVDAELHERQAAEESARVAAAAAAESERRYRLLFESNPLPMWIYDVETLAFIEVNHAAEEHYGYSRDEFLSMTIHSIRPASEVRRLLESVSRSQGAVMDRSGPWKHLRSDGSEVEVEISSHPVDFAGRPARFVMAADVTEREAIRRRLARGERLESLGQMAGSVAHDFNNLLSVMLNYSGFVKEEIDRACNEDPERWSAARDDLAQVARAVDQATGVTRQLLAFGRRERSKPQPLNLNDCISEMESLLRRSIGAHVSLVTDTEADLWPVMADPSRIGQVLVNLAVNARDAMPAGGRLAIETSNIEVDEHYVSLRPGLSPGRYVRLKVADTGTGMDPSVVQHVFEPFFTTKPAGQGTGLGLATIYGIVTQAGGDIQVYSEPGHGTTVSVLLPAADQTPELPVKAEPAAAFGPAGGETVLVVEDEDAIRQITCRILARNGYEVIAAADGLTAIEIAKHHQGRIDLLLTDMVMPGMLGSEVAERIASLQPEARVLFMSGNAPLSSNMLDKPFSEPALLAKVRESLDREEAAQSP